MISGNPDDALREAHTAFETSVTTPVVPGALSDWTDKVRKSWRDASIQVHELCRKLHPDQFKDIAEADAALLQQVELLRSEDEAIEQERGKLDETIARAADHLPKLQPNEAKAQPHVQRLMDQGIAFVARVRKQEVAVQTWFAEAFNRERGGGD
jgi:hypothetical protein